MIVLAVLWRMQERVLYQPPRFQPPADESHRVHYKASDGAALYGYLVGEPRPDGRCVLAFHGNADLAYWQIPWARELFERTGVPVFLAEYRGYGGLPGTPSYRSAMLDAVAARDAMIGEAKCVSGSAIYFGHSLGSAIAVELALRSPPATLMLQAPFTSARAMASRIVGPAAMMWPIVSRIHFDTGDAVSSLDVPVFISHGTRDMIVPIRMGREVFESAKRRGQLLEVEGAGHNDVVEIGDERYWSWIVAAIG